jgi:hypothetical protein
LVVLTVIGNNLISSKSAALCVATALVRLFFLLWRMRERERELGCRESSRMGVVCVCVCVCRGGWVGELLMRATSQRNPSGRG